MAIRTAEELLRSLVKRVRLLERRLAVRGAIPASRMALSGEMKMWPSNVLPDGWLWARGQSVLRADYPDLFAVYGTTFGAVDGTHFNIIDMRGRGPVGLDSGQTEFDTLGEAGGEKSHTISQAELPTGVVCYGGGTAFYVGISAGNSGNAYAAKVHFSPAQTQVSMTNLSPYRVINFIVKV